MAGSAQKALASHERSDAVVLSAAAAGLGDFITGHGGDVDSIFGTCGVAPEVSREPNIQLPLATFCRLFEEAARNTGAENIGLMFGSQFQPRDLGMWGYAALSSATLGAALETLADLLPYQQSLSAMRLVTEPSGQSRLEYLIQAPAIVARRQDAELSLGQYVNLMRECCGRGWAPSEIWFEHPRPREWRQHEATFDAPVFFGCRTNAIVFPSALLSRPMPGRDPRLNLMMRSCLELLGSRSRIETLADRVRHSIRQQLHERLPTVDSVAVELNVPAAAVRRALSDEGLGFRAAVDNVRFALARDYLRERHLPLSEIALLLGYSELSAFSRAFSRWAGMSPLRYRGDTDQH